MLSFSFSPWHDGEPHPSRFELPKGLKMADTFFAARRRPRREQIVRDLVAFVVAGLALMTATSLILYVLLRLTAAWLLHGGS